MAENVTPIGGFSQAGAEMLHEMADNAVLYAQYLRFHGRMYKQSPSVSLEFFVQRPETRFVATQSQWERIGNPVAADSLAIRFRDSHDRIVPLYDLTQCEHPEVAPRQWRMTASGEAAVRRALELPDDQRFLNALVGKAYSPESVTGAMRQLGSSPQNAEIFRHSFLTTVATVIAGRLEVGGNSFPTVIDQSVFKIMNEEQQIGFITMAAAAAKQTLEQVEQVINGLRNAERMVQDEIRGLSEADGRRDGADRGRGAAGGATGTATQLSDAVQSNAEKRRVGLGGRADDGQRQQDIFPADPEIGGTVRRDILVSGESDDWDIRDADRTGRTDDGGETDREIRADLDAVDGGELSGEGRGDEISSSVSDSGTVSERQSAGISGQTGRAVHGSEPASARLREDSGVGADESVLHGQHDDQRHRASGSHNSVSDKIAQAFAPKKEPSADRTDGSSVDKSTHPALTEADLSVLRTIPRKSVLLFTEEERSASAMWSEYFAAQLGSKSPYFRAENGDWRVQEETSVLVLQIPSHGADFKTVLTDIKNPDVIKRGSIKNQDTGWEITISRRGLQDSVGYAERHHDSVLMQALYHLDIMLEHGVLLDTVTAERNKNSKAFTTAFMHELYVPFVFENEAYLAKMAVEEFLGAKGQTSLRLYNAQDIKIVPLNTIGVTDNGYATRVLNETEISIAQLFEIVKTYDRKFYAAAETQQSMVQDNPITKERRAEMLAAFSAKYGLDDLDVFVKKDKDYAGDGRAYDLLIKNGRTVEFQARIFTLAQGERFTEAVLESALANVEQSAEFQQFISFRQGQHTLFDQPEPDRVDTSVNLEPEARERAARLEADVEREWEEAAERNMAADLEAQDALDHHRDVYLRDTCEPKENGYVTNARKQNFYHYRLHFDSEQDCLLMADSDNADDLVIRNFAMTDSSAVLRAVWDMGFEIDSVEPAQNAETESESTIEFGLLGNGITVYDTARAQPHSSDYLTVAHISEEGNIQYFAEISDSDRKGIEAEAARQLAKFTEQWNALSDTEKLMRIMQTANPTQLVQIIGDRLPADQTIAKYEKPIIFHSEDFPANWQKQAATVNDQPPVAEDEKPLSDLISFVRNENQRILEGLEVGDSIGLPSGNYTVTAMNGDFKIDLRSDETGNTGSRIGNWKEMLLNEAGNAPINVVKATVVQQLAEAAAANIPEAIVTPEVDTSVNSEQTAVPQPEPSKQRGRLTRPKELYKLLSEMYPQIVSGEHTHEHYEAEQGSGYEPLSVEMIGDNLYSFMTYDIQNDDLMRDPDITFMLDREEQTAHIFSFQQDGVPTVGTYYVEVADENGRVNTKLQASLEQTFIQNLKSAQFADRTLTRYHDRLGEEVVLVPDTDDVPETHEEPVEIKEPVKVDEIPHLRKVLNAFSEEHGLGELNVRFTGAHEVGFFETYADGSNERLGTQPYWGDNDQISPKECTEMLQRFVEAERRRGRRVEDANGRRAAVSARGKSELPLVPDFLPEIVYAKAPLQKVRDNIDAIRELHRLARCEAAGEPLFDKKRGQWNCKEHSDERLRKYSGWGGLSQVFDAKSGRYAELRTELQKLLTPKEYASAKASATDAHFTPQIVVDAMYQAIQNMGLPRDSRVLEPACGTGNFITRMPHSIGNAGVVGVELDSITAQIAARLNADNPNVTIMHSAFERSGQEDNSFDLVIGNVPFGDYKMNDPDYMQDWLIHDAFFRKALDKVAAGGVVAFVTSTGTLDKKNPKVREYLAKRADLIGAIRLPNNAFVAAGTGVSTDIIFLQKRAEPLPPDAPKPDWCYVTPISQDAPDIRINSFFVQNPQMMLGMMQKTSFQDRLTCAPIEGADLKKQLDAAVRQLNAKITVAKREKAAQERREFIQPWGKQFTYQEKEGKIYYNEGKMMRQITGSAADTDRLKRLIELRILTRQLIDKQKTPVEDFALIPLREQLNRQYDDFVAKYGRISSDAVRKAFGEDSDYALLQSLEEYDSDSKTYFKAEIFNKRTVNPVMEITAVETLEEAYQVSLDQRGKPNIPYMATLLQAQYPDTPFTELTKQVQAELLEKEMVFIDPEKEIAGEKFSGIVERAEYLSGNVRRKLAYALEMAAENPAFQRNVGALQEVIPADIHAEEIAVRMGCPWIDAEDYTKFLQELSGRRSWDTRCEVKYSPVTGEFDILQAGSRKDINVNEGTTYGTEKLTMYEIAQKLLNQRRIAVMMTVPSPKDASKTVTRTDPIETKKAMEKAKLIEEKFAEWIFADPQRKAKYERRYNDLFNSLVGRKYDGSHLTFEGQSASFSLRPHQRDCVARAVYGGNTLAAHVVGAGKSAVFQTAVMKKKQLGVINKACVVVPKPLVEQTAREWRKLYPDARLLTMSAADLSSEAKRDLFAARVATGDYDAVIVSMEQFEKMPMSQEFQKAYLQRQLDDLEDMLREAKTANGNRKDATTKQIESAKKKLKNRLDNIMNPKSKQKGKDILLDFEQLGFDYLVVDEAHNFKNGFVTTKMGNVSGVTTAASDRAQDMQMKCDFFNEQLGQGHLLFCTGTPVSNSMTELYVILRYLRPDLLAAAGVERFDDWAATFGKVTTQHKQSATGELKLKTTFAKFANLPELMQMYKEFADIQSAKKLVLPRPTLKTGKPQIVSVPASPEQRAFVKSLVERARLIAEGSVDPHIDNMLVITNEARLTGLCNGAVAALLRKHGVDVPEGFADAKTGKVDACVDKVAEIYAETAEQKGVQIIFSDVAVNSDDGNFSVYEYIRDELIAKDIPADEIIFAPKSDAKNREDVFRDINAGKYRVVIASTGTLGTGANIQERLAAVHHVDIPWKPSDFEQREGRILRQGNTFSEVSIFNYITEGTMDSYLYQVVTDKARFIAQLLDDETPARVSEDCDDKVLTYGEMQAQAEGNVNFRRRIELGMKVSELEFAKAEFQRETGEMRRKITVIPDEIAALRERIIGIEKDIAAVDRMRNPQGKIDKLTVTTASGKTISNRDDINKFLHSLLYQKQKNPFDDLLVFQIGDFSVTIQMNGSQQDFAFVVQGESPVAYRAAAEFNEKSDNAQRLINLLGNGVPSEKTKCESKIEKLEADLVQAAERAEQTFPHEQELADAKAELKQVEAELISITEMEATILDPDEEPVEETDAERTARKSFFDTDGDNNNDLNPNTDSETLPPVTPKK